MLLFKPRLTLFVCLCLLLGVSIAAAADCPTLVKTALATIDGACANTGRNQACYGNITLSADPQPGIEDFQFRQKGDRVNLLDVKSLRLSAMDALADTWGVALLKVQANLPDTLPGQNVTFLLFGDVSLDNNQTPTTTPAKPAEKIYGPMQAFTFRTGLNDAPCEAAPSSGILIQSPATPPVQLRINAVDITLGSTIYVQLSAASEMLVSVVEGQATLTAFGTTVIAPAGTQVRVTLDGVYAAAAAPSDPEPYVVADLASLPIASLPDAITLAPPLDAAALAALVPPTPTAVPTAASGAGLPTTSDLPLSGPWHAYSKASVCPAHDGEVYDYALPNVQTRFEQDGAVLFIEFAAGQSLTYTRVEAGVYTATEVSEFNIGTYTLRVLAEDHMTVEYVTDNLGNNPDIDGCIYNIEYIFGSTANVLPLSGPWQAHKASHGCPAYDDGVIYTPEQIEYDYDLTIVQTRFEGDGEVLVIEWVAGQSVTYTRVEAGVYTATETLDEFRSITYTLWVLAADQMRVEAVTHDVDSNSDFDGCISDIEYVFTG